MPRRLQTAERYYRFSQRLARRAAQRAARQRSIPAAASVVLAYQAAQAREVEAATAAMLAEQGIRSSAEGAIAPLTYTTPAQTVERMLAEIDREAENLYTSAQFARLVKSLVQDSGRAAQNVAVASRPRIAYVRHLNLPSCSRCAVLAGRVYRYSTGFQRHPNCDCVMVPTTIASDDLTYDLEALVREGQVRGLSKADMEAIAEGADFGQVVNVRNRAAGLKESGRVLSRGDRPTPEGIFRSAESRAEAVDLLRRHGYIR